MRRITERIHRSAQRPSSKPPVRRATKGKGFARPFARMGVLRQQVEWGVESPQRFGQVLQPTIRSIAADRLRRNHGIDPAADRERCRELLGDDRWQLVSGAATTAPTVADLEHLVERIEKL